MKPQELSEINTLYALVVLKYNFNVLLFCLTQNGYTNLVEKRKPGYELTDPACTLHHKRLL